MIRTRFAPSPTGFLHVGGLRTALYSYLFAKKNKGEFVLRIEDTDQKRFVEGAVENLIQTLKTIGLEYDEGPEKEGEYGPYIQSKRTEIYREHAQKLLDSGKAYRCFCTPERLDEMRAKQSAAKQAPMYDRQCLNLTESDITAKLEAGEPHVIRLKIPHGQKLQFKDIIRGVVNFNTSTIDDQVLMKSDNFPTYHLAVVVDDYLMKISHVIRGEEWLPSTPKHILLYEAFGWDKPEFAHIPLLLNPDKSKLSKRQGDVSVESYLEKGYIREAIINFIAMLGWHPGGGEEREIFNLDELIEAFSLEKVHKAGAIFDLEKLNWFNYRWLKKLHHEKLEKIAKDIDPDAKIELNNKKEPVYIFGSNESEAKFTEERAKLIREICKKYLEETPDETLLNKALVILEDKILKNPAEVNDNIGCFFSVKDYDKDLLLNEKMKVDEQIAKKALEESTKSLHNFDKFDDINAIQDHLLALVQQLGLKNGQLLWPMRAALTGEQYSPGVFEMAWTLGKNETLSRLQKGLQKLA